MTRRQYLIENSFEGPSTLVTDGEVALARPDGAEGGDEDAEVLDGFGAREDGGRVLFGLFLFEEFDGKDAGGGEAMQRKLLYVNQSSFP